MCLGVGGLVDLATTLGMEVTEEDSDGAGGVEVWLIDARRPWNLGNVFGGKPAKDILGEVEANARQRDSGIDRGQLLPTYRPGKGGVIVYDDGDITEELAAERDSYCALEGMPDLDDDGEESDDSSDDGAADSEPELQNNKKRKSWSDREEGKDEDSDDDRPRQRRRSSSVLILRHKWFPEMLTEFTLESLRPFIAQPACAKGSALYDKSQQHLS